MAQLGKLMALADEWASECAGCDTEHLVATSVRRQALLDALESALPKEPSRIPTPDVQEKIKQNIWDNFSDVLPTIKAMSRCDWYWGANPSCKYRASD